MTKAVGLELRSDRWSGHCKALYILVPAAMIDLFRANLEVRRSHFSAMTGGENVICVP